MALSLVGTAAGEALPICRRDDGSIHLVAERPEPEARETAEHAWEPADSPVLPEEVNGVLKPLAEATMLPSRAYTDAMVFAFERRQWFAQDWMCVGRTSDAATPGASFVAPVGPAGVIVLRGDDGILRAFHNVCSHRGVTLLDETPTERLGTACPALKKIQCPYHAWSYDLRGRLVRAPFTQDLVGFDKDAHGLRPVRLEAFGGFVFINLGPHGPSLHDWLDDLPAQFDGVPLETLELGHRGSYVVRANWKLLMENFAESYHFGAVHPQLQRKTPGEQAESLLSRGPWQGGWMPLAPGMETVSLDGRRHGRTLLRKEGAQPDGVLDYVLFPNLFLSLQPDYLLAYRLVPVSFEETRVTFDVLFDGASKKAGRFDANDVTDFWHLTNEQDFAICERQQVGVASPGYVPGRYTPVEEGVYEFDKIVAERYASP
jgi:Rieske 2Fe-2S family protein